MICNAYQIKSLAVLCVLASAIFGSGFTTPASAQSTTAPDNQPPTYEARLGFELNEERIKAYIIAGEAVRRINREYDMLISAAPTKQKALEVIASSQQYVDQSFKQIGNINRDQYSGIYDLSLDDPYLAQVIQILKRDMFPDR